MIKEAVLKFLKLDGLIENLSAYVEARLEVFKLEVKEDIAKLMAKFIFFLILALSVLFFLLLLSFSLAYYLSPFVGTGGGLLIIAGCYLVIALISFIYRKKIYRKLEKKLLDIVEQKSK